MKSYCKHVNWIYAWEGPVLWDLLFNLNVCIFLKACIFNNSPDTVESRTMQDFALAYKDVANINSHFFFGGRTTVDIQELINLIVLGCHILFFYPWTLYTLGSFLSYVFESSFVIKASYFIFLKKFLDNYSSQKTFICEWLTDHFGYFIGNFLNLSDNICKNGSGYFFEISDGRPCNLPLQNTLDVTYWT